jgi:SAM-dependent methyltransferase
MTSILDKFGPPALREYLGTVGRFRRFDVEQSYALALAAIRYYGGNADVRDELRAGQALEDRWYASLKAGQPDYSVYDDDFFIGDIWACWVVYSRKYMRMLKKLAPMLDVESIADLGCGIGYTTVALKELFPKADVHGTQIEGTFQFSVAQEVGSGLTTIRPELRGPVDLIFASEYFEHFERPIEHLLDVVRIGKPKYFVIANSFGAHSIGHFDTYIDRRRVYVDEVEQLHDVSMLNTHVGRDFNAILRNSGYELVETGFWNSRPTVWRRVLGG